MEIAVAGECYVLERVSVRAGSREWRYDLPVRGILHAQNWNFAVTMCVVRRLLPEPGTPQIGP